ncbi:pantoate-beta-alanine ligase-like protein [Sodiomyces alkalinus F11]|uniref:Pantoate--beta-alanine ligase n=1 Tax=Sodiomyces alkalinus (strain CBS 110278 / VKM F-3762 / F11) TaxID=1314773 RepID=A0A3N2Q540_SODAK|nr:pantoate-beta-alanine ligase-like protein [Sodiomyces alkalinus F11]ROT41889.1 pantoate-beta-alanine ligase-like protein [Sodiomyces alkalinus F11]
MSCSLSTTAPSSACASPSSPRRSPRGSSRLTHETLPSSSIKVLRSVDALRAWRNPLRQDHRTVALVPTMGALHQGHLALIRAAAAECHHVVVSLFLNPAQFGRNEDLSSYPSTWDADAARLATLDRALADDAANLGRLSAVFAPSVHDMYPEGFPGQDVASDGSFVTITPLARLLEGASRPTFFRGVATVCTKLFNAVQPDRVYFGQKDAQQAVLIRRLVRDFLVPTHVVVVPTVREPDGLALSSRNVYLGPRRRNVAPVLHHALRAAERAYETHASRHRDAILRPARDHASSVLAAQTALPPSQRALFEVDYLSLSDPDTMEELETVDPTRGAILSGAIKMLPAEDPQPGEDLGHSGGPAVRLIDNIILKPATTA